MLLITDIIVLEGKKTEEVNGFDEWREVHMCKT